MACLRGGVASRPAGRALAEEGEVIEPGREPVPLHDRLTQRRDHGVVEEDDGLTVEADQVMVTGIVEKLEAPDATAEVRLAQQAEITEELERAVDGRAVDGRGQRTEASMDLVGGEMLAGRERIEDRDSLRGHALAYPAQPAHRIRDIVIG